MEEVHHTGGKALVAHMERTVAGEAGERKQRDRVVPNSDLLFAGKKWSRRMLLRHVGETAGDWPWVAGDCKGAEAQRVYRYSPTYGEDYAPGRWDVGRDWTLTLYVQSLSLIDI